MEVYWRNPHRELSSEEQELIFKCRKKKKKLENMPPLGEDAEIRVIELYLDKDSNSISYIIQDWTKDKKNLVGYECKFAKDL
jgi:hypothetical protein